jgi:hypothetical protein
MQQCPFDLYKCIRNLMGLMSNYTTGRHQKVTLSTLIDPTVPSFVIGDKQHLRQVLINLLRYDPHTHEGSPARIHSTTFSPPTFIVAATRSSSRQRAASRFASSPTPLGRPPTRRRYTLETLARRCVPVIR